MKTQWSAGDKLHVLFAVTDNKGYEANVGIECPVCKTNALEYQRFTLGDMYAWCRHCENGIQQGRGLAIAEERTEAP